MHYRDSPYSLNRLGIPGIIWFRRFAVTYIPLYIHTIYIEIHKWRKSSGTLAISDIATTGKQPRFSYRDSGENCREIFSFLIFIRNKKTIAAAVVGSRIYCPVERLDNDKFSLSLSL